MTTNWCIDAKSSNFSFGPFRDFVHAETQEKALAAFATKHPFATPITICPEGRPDLRVSVNACN